MLKIRIRALVLAIAAIGFLAVPVERGAARTTLDVGISCTSIGFQRLECYADVTGGTGTYTSYQWSPPSYPGGATDYVIIRCSRPNANQTVYLTVTDSGGNSGRDQPHTTAVPSVRNRPHSIATVELLLH